MHFKHLSGLYLHFLKVEKSSCNIVFVPFGDGQKCVAAGTGYCEAKDGECNFHEAGQGQSPGKLQL